MSKPKPPPSPPDDIDTAVDPAATLQVTTTCDTGLTVAHIRDFNHRVYLHGLPENTPIFGLVSLTLGSQVTQLTCRSEDEAGV